MMPDRAAPLFVVTRGTLVESTHYGSVAIVNSRGELLYSLGDPETVTFMRSSAKPFQALPFFEQEAHKKLRLSLSEQALLCSSHEGSDEHVQVAAAIQAKAGISEKDLQCGVHMPGDASAYRALIAEGRTPTPNRNNCSGKHSGMVALAKLRALPLETYLEISHPIQQDILSMLAEMSGYPREKIEVGIDGCSAPNFALPLYNAALAYARLCDPRELSGTKQKAARAITAAMTGQPRMISGAGEFDCRLMSTMGARVVCKRGAEGFQAIGIMPGVLGSNSKGAGIAFKVSDGDPTSRTIGLEPMNRVRPAVTLEILRQIGAIGKAELEELADFGPELPLKNHRGVVVGTSKPVFQLLKSN